MASRLVVLMLLASIGFFNYHNLFPLSVTRVMFMFCVMLGVLWAYAKNRDVKLGEFAYPRLPWFVFGMMLIVSCFMAAFYHEQSLTASIIAQSIAIFAYGSFFVLLKMNADPDRLMKYLLYASMLGFAVYVVNMATFPHNMFGKPITGDLSRGVIRVYMPLLQASILVLYYIVEKFKESRKKKWLLIAGVFYLFIIMSVIRQVIAITTVMVFLQLFSNVSWSKRIFVGGAIAAIGALIVVNLPIYKSMKELSEEQLEEQTVYDKENVRITAWRYYTVEGNDQVETFLFGNGTPSFGKSVWGKHFEAFTEEKGALTADVSWAGVVYMYGVIAAIMLLVILIMAIVKKKPIQKQYLNYFLATSILEGIASGVFFYQHEIFIIMIALYLVYHKEDNTSTTIECHNGGQVVNSGRRHSFVTR